MNSTPLADPTTLTRWRLGRQPQLWIFVAAATIEILVATLVFDAPYTPDVFWQDVIRQVSTLAKVAIVAFALLLLIAWPRRTELVEAYRGATAQSSIRAFIVANLALFISLMAVRTALALSPEAPSYLLAAYIALLLATGASLAFLAAPPAFWWKLPRIAPVEIAIAFLGGSATLLLGHVAQQGWKTLASSTLLFSHWILSLYETNVVLKADEYILGAGNFSVLIDSRCSGYEGISLVLIFLSVYIWVFRDQLRFPNALLFLPLGAAVIWLLNGLRIAVLVSIGAHISPQVAIEGFHSQAGWISFLGVTLGAIAISRRVSFFTATRPHTAASPSAREADLPAGPMTAATSDQTLAYLAPFIAMLMANLVGSAFAPHDQWLYPLKIVAIGAALWWFRHAYAPLARDISGLSVLVGLAVGVLWIVTDPARSEEAPLGQWIAAQPLELAALWLTLRAIGSVVCVPIAEELAFRGFLSRWMISTRFDTVDFGQFRPLAFFVSSAAFGIMHERWLAAFLAGAVFAILMHRTKRLSDAIIAHAIANLAIIVWAATAQQWSLL